MSRLLLDQIAIRKLNSLVDAKALDTLVLNDYASYSDCDRYDCFFRGVQCPCEGICDGKQ